MNLKPLPGFALIKLNKQYESGLITAKEKYATNSKGILIDFIIRAVDLQVPDLEDHIVYQYTNLKNKTVYFTPYEDGDVIKHEDQEYVLIPVSALRGGIY